MRKNNYCGLVLIVIFMMLLAGCSAPTSRFVLIPSDDGHVGHVEIGTDVGAQSLTKAYETSGASSADDMPAKPVIMDKKEVMTLFGDALAAKPQQPKSFLLYFETGGSVLTADSELLLPVIAADIRQNKAVDVSIIGHSDTVGTKEQNLKISTQRAETVLKQLLVLGLDPTLFEVTSYGMENLLIPTAMGVDEPRNRRVEVVVR